MRLRIFNSDRDYRCFEEILEKTVAESDMRLLAYAIMPNHWHLLLYPVEDGSLSSFMHQLTNKHTRTVKSQTKTIGTGPLYQGRYKSFMIQEDRHLLTALKYIERNPVRARLIDRAENWKWGSAWRRTHGTEDQRDVLARSPVPLPADYAVWVNTPESSELLKKVRVSVNKGAPYGGESWVEKTARQFNLSSTLRNPGRPKGK